MKTIGIIPARYDSTRFPGKPLAMIGNKSMIQRVYERAMLSSLDKVIIATDNKKIEKHAKKFGAEVIMTSTSHKTGTERCAEAFKKYEKDFDIVINIQGDEPFFEPKQIELLIKSFKQKDVQISTLIEKIDNIEDLNSPNTIKVLKDKDSFAIYFSRASIPFVRGHEKENWLKNSEYFKHIGIYAFRSEVLKKIVKLQSVKIEKAESLEQLRWLFNGYKIKLTKTKYYGLSVDTAEDLEKANEILTTVYQ
ncbi:MAG: 3-deoxy-manno-octulosonate cytidylyltransferase [Bacteroidota bacterium]|nr:3-deoxy-manno-octulosonate cytidylyltransferase [Bacteroidota bacterium]